MSKSRNSSFVDGMVEGYRHKLKDGVPREVILADMADSLRKRRTQWRSAETFSTSPARCAPSAAMARARRPSRSRRSGRRSTAPSSSPRPKTWMTKRDAKYREDVGDAEFWENAFTRHRRKPRTDQPKKQEE